MRVLFLNASGTVGGAERVLLDVLTSLRGSAVRRDLSLIAPPGDLIDRAATIPGVTVAPLALPDALAATGESAFRFRGVDGATAARSLAGGAVAASRYASDLRAAILAARPDIVHSNSIKTHLLSAPLTPRRVPVVWHLHDFLRDRPMTARLLRVASRRAAVAVANSHAVGADAEPIVGAGKVEVVHNGVDLQRFQPHRRSGPALDRLAGLDPAGDDAVRVGIVATYARWKGQDLFLRACARLQRRARVPVRFYVIGGPIYRTLGSQFDEAELRALATQLGLAGAVGFVPFQREPSEVYGALDVFVHGSTVREPFGLTIVEAMACGCACVVAAEGGAAELFTDGEDALGYVPRDEASLADAVDRLIHEPALRKRLATGARANVEARFDTRRVGEALGRIYDRLAR